MKLKLGSLVGAVLILFALVGTALANDLHQTPPITGTQFGSSDCSDGLGVGWIFVNTGSHDATDAVLTATFSGARQVQADGFTPGDGTVHYFVPVSPSDTLLSASDNLDTDGLLNLSHVCVGTTESASPSESANPSESATPTESSTPTESVSPSDSATPTDSSAPTESASPSDSSTPTGSAEASSGTSTPTGSAEASSGTPVTPPATTTNGAGGGSGNGALLFALVLMALASTGILVLAPYQAKRRR